MVKNLPANAKDLRDVGLIHGLGRAPEVGHGNPLQYSCLENPMDRGAWWAMVHSVAQSQTLLKRLSTHACTHTHISTYVNIHIHIIYTDTHTQLLKLKL